MHELSVMQCALDLALDQAGFANARKVCSIRLRVGAISGVVPEVMQTAFEVLTIGTIAEGAELVIDHIAARYWCNSCRREFEAARLCAQCPDCGNPSRELRAGRELELASLEID